MPGLSRGCSVEIPPLWSVIGARSERSNDRVDGFMKLKIQQSGFIFRIQREDGALWMGPTLPRHMQWESPREPGADVPC